MQRQIDGGKKPHKKQSTVSPRTIRYDLYSSHFPRIMGRDQVKRNQAARGRGGRGAGGQGGRGGGGGSGGKSSNRRSTGKSPSSSSALLGDNSHRYDHHPCSRNIDVVDEYDEDDGGRMEDFDNAFAHYDASLSMGGGNDALDFFAGSGTTTRNSHNVDNSNNNNETKARNSWMEIDTKAMDIFLQQHVPLHVRLQVPPHIASHIEERYGVNSKNIRNKTLAELREESKCIVDDGGGGASSNEALAEQDDSNNVKVDNGVNEKDDADDDDDEEDLLEAWLDDVLS